MPVRLTANDASFEQDFQNFLDAHREAAVDVNDVVTGIVEDVRQRGDQAVIELTSKFDRQDLTAETLAFSEAEITAALEDCAPDTLAALEVAARRIKAYHARQKPADDRFIDDEGVELGHRWTAIAAVGLYVPGGSANYPSSVLMNAIPASVAGVDRIAMVVPTPDGVINPLVLAAAKISGVSEIYRIGGAQAIAALAYGTATIPAVDTIVGPGNAYVAAAKRQVFGVVGIDMIAGPSEILVVADGHNDPSWIAADLLSQAEHGDNSQSILITDDADFADRVSAETLAQIETLDRREIAAQAWENFGAIIVVDRLDDAAPLVDRLAPEHLELAVDEPEALMGKIRNAGSIFLGRHTPEAIGDYVAGTNHVLPTGRTARFSSGLSVLDFMKRSSIIRCDPASLARIGPAAVELARVEGLGAHGRSVSIRTNQS